MPQSSTHSLSKIRDNIRDIGHYKYPLLRASFVIPVIYVFIMMGLLVFLAEFLHIPNSDSSVNSLFIITSSILGIIVPFLYLFWIRYHYDEDENFPQYKEILNFLDTSIEQIQLIEKQYIYLKGLINLDKDTTGINPSIIISIRDSIQKITNLIVSTRGIGKELQEERKFSHIFNDEQVYMTYLSSFLGAYNQLNMAFFDDFEKSIKEWLTLHAEELEEIEKTIDIQTKIAIGDVHNKSALELQGTRIQNYVDSLKQVQITI